MSPQLDNLSSNSTKWKEPWFAVRRELNKRRQFTLTLCSFLLPLSLWCLVSYTPYIWKPDVKLLITAKRAVENTSYNAGDRLSKDFFPKFRDTVVEENQELRALRKEGKSLELSAFKAYRRNINILRQIRPIASANGWLNREEAEEDAKLFEIWGKLARGELTSEELKLSDRNKSIIARNWKLLSENSDTFDKSAFPTEPMEKLVPQGIPATPVYLPAPHEVINQGYEDFTQAPGDEDDKSMADRYRQSLYIVFTGFFLSMAVGLPLGILSGTFDFFSKLIEPFVDFFRYMPAPAFSTLLVAIFMADDAPKLALIFLGTFFQLVLVTANTTRGLNMALIESAQTLGAKRWTLFRRVVIPGVAPDLYNNMRILLGWAWTWLVIAELVGVKSGLTQFIETQGRFRNFDSVFPVILLIGVTGFVTDQILASLRKYIFPWAPDSLNKKRGPVMKAWKWIADQDPYIKSTN